MNISEIDKNLKVDTDITEPDIVWLDAKSAPFRIYGLIYDDALGKYLRMPDPIARSTSTAVSILNDNTAGGRLRFRTNSGFIGIYAVMKNALPFSHMPATGKSGFDLYRKTDDREGFVYYHSLIPP